MAETSPIERADQTESIQPFSALYTRHKKKFATFLTSGSTISRPGVSSQKAFRKGPTASTSSPHASQDLPTSASTMLLRLFKKKSACPKFVRNYYCIRISRYAAFVPPSRPPCLPSVFADCGNRVQRVGWEVWSTWLPKYRPSGDQVWARWVTKYDASRHQVAREASPFYSSTWTSFTRPFSWISTLSAKGPPLNEHPRKFIYQS